MQTSFWSEIGQSGSAQIGPFTVIGHGTTIGNKTSISNSVVGESCSIGSNLTIEGCYIWHNVTVEDGCKLKHAILCDGGDIEGRSIFGAWCCFVFQGMWLLCPFSSTKNSFVHDLFTSLLSLNSN